MGVRRLQDYPPSLFPQHCLCLAYEETVLTSLLLRILRWMNDYSTFLHHRYVSRPLTIGFVVIVIHVFGTPSLVGLCDVGRTSLPPSLTSDPSLVVFLFTISTAPPPLCVVPSSLRFLSR